MRLADSYTGPKVIEMPARTMERVWSSVLWHDGYGFNRVNDSKALCRIYSDGIGAVVILTEPNDNHGTSVTNCYERIARKLCVALGQFIPVENYPEKVTWLEQYERAPEELTLITLVWDKSLLRFSRPRWSRLASHADFCGIPWTELCRIPEH
jgi:hypothetical protein